MTKPVLANPHLRSWDALNTYLMKETDEKKLEKLLKQELECGRNRQLFVKRIYHRLSKIRRVRERQALEIQDEE